ncbi:site-specific integrase [Pedobacter gandavensis]|nr:site-specific integrase [Pedobacter gandavensis]
MFSFSSKLWYDKRRVNSETGEVSLCLQIVIDSKHKAIPLKLRWPAELVDLVNGKLLPRIKKDPEVLDYNLIIESERAKHTEIHRIYRIKQEHLTLERFAHEIRVFNARECFSVYLDTERKKRYARKEIGLHTCRNEHPVVMRILKFDKLCLFRQMDARWMKRLKSYLLGEDYSMGTVWTTLKVIKTYLRLASKEPMYYVNPEAMDYPNPMPFFKTTFLNKDEVRNLMKLQRSGKLNDIELRVLKAFLFTCFTSLRISDLYVANACWRIDTDYLQFIPFKNRKAQRELRIPLMEMAKSFISDISGVFFSLPTSVEYNRTLKDIAHKAEIKKRLTSHVGRHTFGYLYMTNVGNLKALQEIMGHKYIYTTERYAHLDDAYKLESLSKIQEGFKDLVNDF